MTTVLKCKGYMPDFKFGAQSVWNCIVERQEYSQFSRYIFSDAMEIKEIETISVLILI